MNNPPSGTCHLASDADRPRRLRRTGAGYTLVELLVVAGILSFVAAGIGLALRAGEGGFDAGAGGAVLEGAFATGRARAVLLQQELLLCVEAGAPARRTCLRRLLFVTPEGRRSGAPVDLPSGVAVVPDFLPAVEGGIGVEAGVAWPSGSLSSMLSTGPELDGVRTLHAGTFLPNGTFTPAGAGSGRRIVIGSVRRVEGGLLFRNPAGARAFEAGHYGTVLPSALPREGGAP